MNSKPEPKPSFLPPPSGDPCPSTFLISSSFTNQHLLPELLRFLNLNINLLLFHLLKVLMVLVLLHSSLVLLVVPWVVLVLLHIPPPFFFALSLRVAALHSAMRVSPDGGINGVR